jgi:hypothetical protein
VQRILKYHLLLQVLTSYWQLSVLENAELTIVGIGLFPNGLQILILVIYIVIIKQFI